MLLKAWLAYVGGVLTPLWSFPALHHVHPYFHPVIMPRGSWDASVEGEAMSQSSASGFETATLLTASALYPITPWTMELLASLCLPSPTSSVALDLSFVACGRQLRLCNLWLVAHHGYCIVDTRTPESGVPFGCLLEAEHGVCRRRKPVTIAFLSKHMTKGQITRSRYFERPYPLDHAGAMRRSLAFRHLPHLHAYSIRIHR